MADPTLISMSLTGSEAAARLFDELPDKVRKGAIRKALRAAAKTVAADARRGAPHLTGDLESSIKVRAAKGSKGKRLPKGQVGIAVSSSATANMYEGKTFYGGFIEFGTTQRETKEGKNRGSIDANPFLRPALWNNASELRRQFRKHIRDFVNSQQKSGGALVATHGRGDLEMFRLGLGSLPAHLR